MIKTITIDENTELTLSNNVGWMMEYQAQFGRDIIPDLMPVLAAVLDLIGELNEREISAKDAKGIAKAIAGDAAASALIELSGLRMTDLINIVWAMAKTADETIDDPRKWIRSFETFPLDVIVPEAFMLVAQGVVSAKNWTRLQKSLADLRAPKKKAESKQGSTISSSQA